MFSSYKPLYAAGLALCLAGAVSAQRPGSLSQLPTSQARSFADAFGVSRSGDQLLAGGPGYHVTFAAEGPIYTPALPTAERLFPLSMRCTGYGRGEPTASPGAAELSSRGDTVSYHRAGFVETYEARRDGLKQSFVFSQLPAGAGDLVVRVALETDLTLAHTAPDGALTFLRGDHGGLTIGKVVGVDADGARCEGSMSYVDGRVDMRLPADFIDGAALPVVLDPLVGPAFTTSTGNDNIDHDVAYDATNDLYLVIWCSIFSTSSGPLRGQRFDSAGNLVGGLQSFGDPSRNYIRPRVANIASEDCFVVAASGSTLPSTNSDIYGFAIGAAVGSVASAEVVIKASADDLDWADVGGEATETGDRATVVWDNTTTHSIEAAQVQIDNATIPPTITPSPNVVTVAPGNATYEHSIPKISKSGGRTGNHMIVWTRLNAGGTLPFNIRGAIFSRQLNPLDPAFPVTQGPGLRQSPAVDGDGANWIVAWEYGTGQTGFQEDIQARSIGFDPNAGAAFAQSAIVDVAVDPAIRQELPSVTWTGDAALIMWMEDVGTLPFPSNQTDYDLYAKPVDLFTALDAGPEEAVDVNSADASTDPHAASKATGGDFFADDVMLVYDRSDSVGNLPGLARRFVAEDGLHAPLGGRCGQSGRSYATSAAVGETLSLRLRGSRPSQAAWLVLSPGRIDLSCGSCTLVPDPLSGFVLVATTDTRGDAVIPVPLPSDPALQGVSFFHQWLVSVPAGAPAGCASFGADLSNTLQTTIQ